MRIFTDLFAAQQAIIDFAIDKPEGCPTAIFDMLRVLKPTDLVQWEAIFREVYFATHGVGDGDSVGPELAQIVAGALLVFAQSGFHEIGKNGIAARMRLALLRDAGEPAADGAPWPDPSEDPSQNAVLGLPEDFVPPPPPAE